MIIYDSEKHLSDIIKSSCKSRITSAFTLKDTVDIDQIKKSLATIDPDVVDLYDHPDFLVGSAIMVSTVWNLNDDVFLPEDTWKALESVKNVPMNNQHIEKDIVGHVYAYRILDESGEIVTAEDDSDEYPDYFDVDVDWVVYKTIFPEIASEVCEKGPKQEKFVSMECYLEDFSYALMKNGTDELKVVARNENTAFLTRYLRSYGGSGEYNGYKIGRVLKNFRFCGLGIVDNPANPDSLFTSVKCFKNKIKSDCINLLNNAIYILKGHEMKKFEKIEDAIAEVEALSAKVDDMVQKISDLEAELVVEKEKFNVVESKLDDANKQAETLKSSVESKDAELAEAKAKLDEIAKAKKIQDRVSVLAELGVTISDEKKECYASMSDDAFAQIVEISKSLSKKEDKDEDTIVKAEDALKSVASDGKTQDLDNLPSDKDQDDPMKAQIEAASKAISAVLNKRKNTFNKK